MNVMNAPRASTSTSSGCAASLNGSSTSARSTIRNEPVPLRGLSAIIESTDKALLFKRAGPEQAEIVAKTAGNRKRLAAAFETSEDKLYDTYSRRLANPQTVVRSLPRMRRCTR